MAAASDISKVEMACGYTFKKKHLLALSLTAAGAEPDNKNGNRSLAKFGQTAIHFVIAKRGYDENLRAEGINAMHTFFQSKEQRAAVADSAGVVGCMKLCERSGAASKTVKSLALSALIGAAWLDSGSVNIVAGILTRLHHISQPGSCSSLKLTNSSPITESNAVTIPATVDPADTLLIGSEPGHDLTVADNEAAESLFLIVPEVHTVGFEQSFSLPSFDFNDMTEDLTSSRASQQSERRELSLQITQEENHTASSPRSTHPQLQRRPRPERPRSSHGCSQWLTLYIRKDEERCQKYSIPSPWEGFHTQTVTYEIAKFSRHHHEIFLKVWVGLCNPASVIELRDTIRILRDDSSISLPSPQKSLPTKERMRAIETAEQKMASYTLLRRLHVLRLWQDEEPSKDPCWVNFDGLQDLGAEKSIKKSGNPRNAAESQATAIFVERVYPNLDKSSPEYERLFGRVKRLRKLGRRLDMLRLQFGLGIFGLMPCSELNFGTRLSSAISDSMLLTPTDGDFKGFLSLLETTQGDMLRKFSSAAYPIVKSIYDGTLCRSVRFPVEQSLPERILSSAKGSDMLLSCLNVQGL